MAASGQPAPTKYWFHGESSPDGHPIKVPGPGIISGYGIEVCLKFFELSEATKHTLPLKGEYAFGKDTEVDAFLAWSKYEWSQLKRQSVKYYATARNRKDWDPEKTLTLQARIKGQADLPLLCLQHFLSTNVCQDSYRISVFWKCFALHVGGRKDFQLIVLDYFDKLCTVLMKNLAADGTKVKAMEAAFSERHMEARSRFIRGALHYPLKNYFQEDKWLQIMKDGGAPHVFSDSSVLYASETVPGCFLEKFERSIFKVFSERVFLLDRPTVNLATYWSISEGRHGNVLYYVSGWLLRAIQKRFSELLRSESQDEDTEGLSGALDAWSLHCSFRTAPGSDFPCPVKLLEERNTGGGLLYVTEPFFALACEIELFLGRRLTFDNLRFFGGDLMVKLHRQLLSLDIVRLKFVATIPEAAQDFHEEMCELLLPAIIRVCPTFPLLLHSRNIASPKFSLSPNFSL